MNTGIVAQGQIQCRHCGNVWKRGPSDSSLIGGRCCDHLHDVTDQLLTANRTIKKLRNSLDAKQMMTPSMRAAEIAHNLGLIERDFHYFVEGYLFRDMEPVVKVHVPWATNLKREAMSKEEPARCIDCGTALFSTIPHAPIDCLQVQLEHIEIKWASAVAKATGMGLPENPGEAIAMIEQYGVKRKALKIAKSAK